MAKLIFKLFLFSMAVVAAIDGGWIIDHEQSINAAYTETRVCSLNQLHAEDGSKSCSYCSIRTYVSLQDLFAINEPFCMDSQFAKLANSSELKSHERNLQVYSQSGFTSLVKHCLGLINCFNEYLSNSCGFFVRLDVNDIRVKTELRTTFGITDIKSLPSAKNSCEGICIKLLRNFI
jgi:hypothetical protein